MTDVWRSLDDVPADLGRTVVTQTPQVSVKKDAGKVIMLNGGA